MLVSDFDYHLPVELIAQEPLNDRAASRMLVVDRDQRSFQDRHFRDLPTFIQPGDCLIVNSSKVLSSRLLGRRPGRTAVIEVFLLKPVSDDELTWEALVRPGRKAGVGERIQFSDQDEIEILGRGEHGARTIRFLGKRSPFDIAEELGHTPLPPYIRRPDTSADRERYQTVYAREPGSVAAPTAGLHFTREILDACINAGGVIAPVTLHVGMGTFAPLRADKIEDIKLHAERFCASENSMRTIQTAQRRIAVGTTSVRTLETIYATGRCRGTTDLFIYPGYQFRATDAILTNFHLPKSSLLLLVSAFGGTELIRAAYDHAVRERYRFFSYGDCMLIV